MIETYLKGLKIIPNTIKDFVYFLFKNSFIETVIIPIIFFELIIIHTKDFFLSIVIALFLEISFMLGKSKEIMVEVDQK